MRYPNIILPLCLLTRDSINYLKTHKHYPESKQLHGAKKTLIRFLLLYYEVVAVQRVLQLYNGGRHCMIKFTFNVCGRIISYHTPADDIYWDYKLTNENVKVLIGKIPVDGETKFTTVDEVRQLTNILNQLSLLDTPDRVQFKKVVTRLEDYVCILAPKRYV